MNLIENGCLFLQGDTLAIGDTCLDRRTVLSGKNSTHKKGWRLFDKR